MNKKTKIIIMSILLGIYTILMLVFVFPWNKGPSNFTDAKDGVVSIHTEFGMGSGFAIGVSGKPVQYIATNYHVVFDDGEKAEEVRVYFSEAANRYMIAQIYSYDEAKDIAVLKLPEPTKERVALTLRKMKDVDMSQTYYALGYPARAETGSDYTKYDISDIVTTSGMLSKQSMIGEVKVYMLDLQITHGNSGGPLVNKDGEVVGINTFSISNSYGESANYAVCIDELTKIIDSEYVDYEIVGENLPLKIISILLIIVVDVAVIIAIVSIARSNKSAVDKQKISKSTEIQGYGETIAVSSQNAIIVGLSGIYKGKELELKEKMVFGRDSTKCDVVFPMDTEGVSGHHCVITYKNQRIIMRDIGSSYGTYINNGLKIDQNVDLEMTIGDTFYLGSEQQKFMIKMK